MVLIILKLHNTGAHRAKHQSVKVGSVSSGFEVLHGSVGAHEALEEEGSDFGGAVDRFADAALDGGAGELEAQGADDRGVVDQEGLVVTADIVGLHFDKDEGSRVE